MNAFNWQTGPSLMATEFELKKAKLHSQRTGMAIDAAGRPTVNLAPMKSNISISKSPQADADKTQKIRGARR